MAVLKQGDWVTTKMNRIGCVMFEETDTHVYLIFPKWGSRSYKRDSLVLLDEPMQKLLNFTWKEFVNELIF